MTAISDDKKDGLRKMFFKPKLFMVFHSGYPKLFRDGRWFSDAPPPAWYLIMPRQTDSEEIARMKLEELGLAITDEYYRGIPDVGSQFSGTLAVISYTTGEISNFLFAVGSMPVEYDFDSIKVFHPRSGYAETPMYRHCMSKVRRSIALRSSVGAFVH